MTTITTTLNKIRSFSPCKQGWEKLLASLNKTQADDEPLDYLQILESNEMQDTIWCMRCEWFENKEIWMQFVTNCKESAAAAASAASADSAAYAAYTAAAAYADSADSAAAAAAAASDSASVAAAYASAAASAAAYAAAYASADSAAYDSASASATAYASERTRQANFLRELLS